VLRREQRFNAGTIGEPKISLLSLGDLGDLGDLGGLQEPPRGALSARGRRNRWNAN
jgi:hypothetical protein